MNGWVKISRDVTNHPMFEGRADWLGAWVMLIAKANYEDKYIKRGQVRLSHAGLQKMFGWSRKKVRYFLDELRSNGMVSWVDEGSRKGQVGATISICNYCKFQNLEENKGHVGATLGPQTERRKKEEELKLCAPAAPSARADKFDEFWSVFPVKKGKKEARKAWDKATKSAPADEIIAGASRYTAWLARVPNPPAPKWAQGWLSGERWQDVLDMPTNGKPVDDFEAIIEEQQRKFGGVMRHEDDIARHSGNGLVHKH